MKKRKIQIFSRLKNIDWKKYYGRIFSGILLVVLAVFMISNVWLHMRLVEMDNRMSYLQDTTNVIQTELGSLQSDIEKTLREENSILESCSMEVVDTDFSAGTYQLAVTAIPKEYTDKTEMSIFFGTTEYPLVRDGFTFTGSVQLQLTDSYDRNVTVLITNGSKRNTEVMADYEGFQEKFDDVLSGSITALPVYSGGNLSVKADVDFNLEGTADTYGVSAFSSLKLIVEAEGKKLYEEELITADEAPEGTTEADEDLDDNTTIVKETVAGIYGNKSIRLKEPAEAGTEVRVYLQAVSTDGYTFQYELFHDTTLESGGFEESSGEIPKGEYRVLDRKGGLYEPAAK